MTTLLPVPDSSGGGFFGQGFLEGAWDALNYKILPEEAPGPFSALGHIPGFNPVYGVVRDFSTPLDLGITAAAAAAAPFTGGGSLIARAAIGGGVKGVGAKGLKFVLAPAVEGSFTRRLAAEGMIGLGAVGGGQVGSSLGGNIGGTPGAIIGGLAGGFAGGGVGLGAARTAFGKPRIPMGVSSFGADEQSVIASLYQSGETLPGGSNRFQSRSSRVGKFQGHMTDGEMTDRGLDERKLVMHSNEEYAAEPDHGALSSAMRYMKGMAAGMGVDYDPNTRRGRLIGLLRIFKTREDQAPGLVNQMVSEMEPGWKEFFTDGRNNVLTIPSIKENLLVPDENVRITLFAVDPGTFSSGQIDSARIGIASAGGTSTPKGGNSTGVEYDLPGAERVAELLEESEQQDWTMNAIRGTIRWLDSGEALEDIPDSYRVSLERFSVNTAAGSLGAKAQLTESLTVMERNRAGLIAQAKGIEESDFRDAILKGEALQNRRIRILGAGPTATTTTVNSSTMSQVFEFAFDNKMREGDSGAVKFGGNGTEADADLILRALPDGRYINPQHGFIFSKDQAEWIAGFHSLVNDADIWLTGTAGAEVMRVMMNLMDGQRYTPRIVIDRYVALAKSKLGDTPSRPLDTSERFENARMYPDDEVNDAIARNVVYENDMMAVLTSHLNAVLRAGRAEQLKTSLYAGGFEEATKRGKQQLRQVLTDLKDQVGVAGGPVDVKMTAEQAMDIGGLKGVEGRKIAEEVVALFESSAQRRESTRQIISSAPLGSPSTGTLAGGAERPVTTGDVYRDSMNRGDVKPPPVEPETRSQRRERELAQVEAGGPAVEGEIETFRGESRSGQGSVARGEIGPDGLQLGPGGSYVSPSEAEAKTFGPVTKKLLNTNFGGLDLDAPFYDDSPLFKVMQEAIMGFDRDDLENFDSIGEAYVFLQGIYARDGFGLEGNTAAIRRSQTLPTGITAAQLRKDGQLSITKRKQGYALPEPINPIRALENQSAATHLGLNNDLKKAGVRFIKSTDPSEEYLVLDERALRTPDPNYKAPTAPTTPLASTATEDIIRQREISVRGGDSRPSKRPGDTTTTTIGGESIPQSVGQRQVRTPWKNTSGRPVSMGSTAGGRGTMSRRLYDASGELPGSDVLKSEASRQTLKEQADALLDRLTLWENTLKQMSDPIFQGNFYDEKTANVLSKFTGADEGILQRNMKNLSEGADALRTVQASGDLSGAFIQGLLLLAVNPVAWGAGIVGMAKTLTDPQYLNNYLIGVAPKVRNWRDLQIAAPTEMFRGNQQRGLLARASRGIDKLTGLEKLDASVPLPGQRSLPLKPGALTSGALNAFERAFTYYGTYARVELMSAFEGMARTPHELIQAQEIVNKMTGVTSHGSQILGPKQEHFERTFMFFAPRYTRASLGAVWAMVNPKAGIQGTIARDAVTKLVIGGTISYVMFAEAVGQEPKLDPTKGDFMTLEINGDRIGVGTVWTSMARLVGDLAADPAFEGKLGSSPLLFQNNSPGGAGVDERIMRNPLIKWVRNRTSVISGTAWEIATGADYVGNPIEGPIDVGKHIASNALPFALESAILGSPRRTHSGILAPNQVNWSDPRSYVPSGIGSEFMGLRNSPTGFAAERNGVRDKMAIKEHGVPWGELNKLDQSKLEAGSLELTSLTAQARRQRVIRGDEIDAQVDGWYKQRDLIDEMYDQQLEFGLNALRNGQIDFRDFRQNHLAAANQARRVRLETMDDDRNFDKVREWFEFISNDLPGTNPEKPEDVAYTKYLHEILLNESLSQPEGFDYREKRRLESDFERDHGTDTYNYVRARLAHGKELDPFVQELIGGQEEFKWYWGSADEPGSINWQIIQNRNNPTMETALFVQWEESKDEDKFVLEASSSVLRAILKQRSAVRAKVREFDPRLDVFLFRWGYTNSLNYPGHQFDGARKDAKGTQAMETYMLTTSTLDSAQTAELESA
jgi:hypothetical protein